LSQYDQLSQLRAREVDELQKMYRKVRDTRRQIRTDGASGVKIEEDIDEYDQLLTMAVYDECGSGVQGIVACARAVDQLCAAALAPQSEA
jgi:hypothetical protein